MADNETAAERPYDSLMRLTNVDIVAEYRDHVDPQLYDDMFALVSSYLSEDHFVSHTQVMVLCVLLGSLQDGKTLLEIIAKLNPDDPEGAIGHLLYKVTCPSRADSWDIAAWQQVLPRVLRESQVLKMLRFSDLDKIQRICRQQGFKFKDNNEHSTPAKKSPRSMGKDALLDAICQATYPSYQAEYADVAKLFLQYNKDPEHFDTFMELKDQVKNSDEAIPPIEIDGASLGYPGYTLCKLSQADPKGLILGEMTGCCQTLGGQGESCAINGFTSENSDFYVLFKGKPKRDSAGKIDTKNMRAKDIIACSWAVRAHGRRDTTKSAMILDSIEYQDNLSTDANNLMISRIYQTLAEQLIIQDPSISRVVVGYSKISTLVSFEESDTDNYEQPAEQTDYSDAAGDQWVVAVNPESASENELQSQSRHKQALQVLTEFVRNHDIRKNTGSLLPGATRSDEDSDDDEEAGYEQDDVNDEHRTLTRILTMLTGPNITSTTRQDISQALIQVYGKMVFTTGHLLSALDQNALKNSVPALFHNTYYYKNYDYIPSILLSGNLSLFEAFYYATDENDRDFAMIDSDFSDLDHLNIAEALSQALRDEKVIQISPEAMQCMWSLIPKKSKQHLVAKAVDNCDPVVIDRLFDLGLELPSMDGYSEFTSYSPLAAKSKHPIALLTLAIEHNDLELVKSLFSAGIDPNSTEPKTGLPMLLFAIDKSNQQVIEALLAEADLMITDVDGRNIYHYLAQNITSDIIDTVSSNMAKRGISPEQVLLAMQAEDHDGLTPLHLAAQMNHVVFCHYAIAKGVDPNIKTSAEGQTPLHIAAAANSPDVVEYFLGETGAPPPHGLLMYSPAGDGKPLVDCNAVDNVGGHAIHYAAAGGSMRAFTSIYKHTSETVLRSPDRLPIIYYAALAGSEFACRHLMDEGEDINFKDQDGKSLMLNALENNKAHCVALLIKLGAEILTEDVITYAKALSHCSADTANAFFASMADRAIVAAPTTDFLHDVALNCTTEQTLACLANCPDKYLQRRYDTADINIGIAAEEKLKECASKILASRAKARHAQNTAEIASTVGLFKRPSGLIPIEDNFQNDYYSDYDRGYSDDEDDIAPQPNKPGFNRAGNG